MITSDAADLSRGDWEGWAEMDHDYIEQNHIADRYVMGKLPPEEADRFEEHYLSCQACVDRLERAEALQGGLKRAAAEDAVRLAAVRRAGLFAALAGSRRLGFGLAALCAVLLLPSLLAYREAGRLGRQLDRANAELAERARGIQRSAAGGERDAATARAELATERRRLEGQLAQERDARAGLERQLSQAWQPQTNTPILSLSPERGGAEAEPTHRVHLPQSPGWIVLTLDLDHPESPRYRVTVLRDGKTEVWQGGGLQPNGDDALVVTLPSKLLKPGDYALRVDGEDGKAVARFTFRAI
jgi:multidrug efflux pump subunit AcrA (membrane-fusion protein)